MKRKILVINGPNLNMTGVREPSVYGADTLDTINAEIARHAAELGVECDFFQSNCEGEIINAIHSVFSQYDACVINAGAYTHYSYAIADAIRCVAKPFVEVHISNPHAREDFRHTSVISPVCKGTIQGFGKRSYLLAVDALSGILNDEK